VTVEGPVEEGFNESSNGNRVVVGCEGETGKTVVGGKMHERREYNIKILRYVQCMFAHLSGSKLQYYVPKGFWRHFRYKYEQILIISLLSVFNLLPSILQIQHRIMRVVGSCNDSRTVIFLATYVFTLACMHLFQHGSLIYTIEKNTNKKYK